MADKRRLSTLLLTLAAMGACSRFQRQPVLHSAPSTPVPHATRQGEGPRFQPASAACAPVILVAPVRAITPGPTPSAATASDSLTIAAATQAVCHAVRALSLNW